MSDDFEVNTVIDDVNHPDHYKGQGTIDLEAIEAIKGMLPPEEFRGYLRGNILKYLWRYPKKGLTKDLRKLNVYLGWLHKHENMFKTKLQERELINDGQNTVSSE